MSNELLEAPTIWELVRRRAQISGDAPMLLDTAGRRVSWTEFVALAQLVIERQRAVPFVTGDSLEAQPRKLHHLPGERQTFLRGVHSAAVHAGVDLNHDPQR